MSGDYTNERVTLACWRDDHASCPTCECGCHRNPHTLINAREALINLAIAHHAHRCPRYGHWLPYENTFNRPKQYSDPRIIRIDCHDDQCLNSACVTYSRCTHEWHDMDEAITRYNEAQTR